MPQNDVAEAVKAIMSPSVTDALAKAVFLDTSVTSEEDLSLLVQAMHVHRPKVYAEITASVRRAARVADEQRLKLPRLQLYNVEHGIGIAPKPEAT